MRLKFISLFLSILFIFFSCKKFESHPLYIEGDGVTDFEGNFYKTVVIGDQEWMAENLKSKIYCNGDSIPYTINNEYYKAYNNNLELVEKLGYHYNYLSVESSAGLCPCGWRVATFLDFDKLITYVSSSVVLIRALKSISTIEDPSQIGTGVWTKPNNNKDIGNNKSGFSALPAGYIIENNSFNIDTLALFWLDTEEYNALEEFSLHYTDSLGYNRTYLITGPFDKKEIIYHSIRCVKNF